MVCLLISLLYAIVDTTKLTDIATVRYSYWYQYLQCDIIITMNGVITRALETQLRQADVNQVRRHPITTPLRYKNQE